MREISSRLRNDAQLAIITSAALLALSGLIPFAVYRAWHGDVVMAAVDSMLALCTLGALYISWVHHKAQLAGHILGVLYTLGVIVAAIQLPASGLYWFYCAILFNFFIIPPLRSTLIILTTLAVLCGYGLLYPGTIFVDLAHLFVFASTALICSLFAFMFAWRTARQRRQLQRLAYIDPLTGIGNRRTLMAEMDIALSSFKRHGTQCGLLLLDLDNFKQINDNHGHGEGDRVLVELARLVRSSSRTTDRLFRLGGEEFVLLLANVDVAGLETAAQHIVASVGAKLRSHDQQVTVSIGGALLEPGDDSITWMHRADVCLYRAKDAGRNCCMIHRQTD